MLVDFMMIQGSMSTKEFISNMINKQKNTELKVKGTNS